jgi:hypothetical protein
MHNNLKSDKFLKLQYNHIHNMGCKRASENQLKIKKNVPNYKIKKHLRFYYVHLILFATNKMSKCYWFLISKHLYNYRRCLIYLSNVFFYSSLHIIIVTVLMLTIKTFFFLYLKQFSAFNFTLILLWTQP